MLRRNSVKKRRKLRKRVYVIIILVFSLLIAFLGYQISKKTKQNYLIYDQSPSQVTLSFKNEGYLYTFEQHYFYQEDVLYYSVNDLYNAFIHIDDGKMNLVQNKAQIEFQNNYVEGILNYKKQKLILKQNQLSDESKTYFDSLHKENQIDLQEKNLPVYICEGEIYLAQELVEKILFNNDYVFDLQQQTMTKK